MSTIDALNRIVELADAIETYWDRELPKAHPDYPLVHEGECSPPPPPEQQQLEDFVRSLADDQIFKALLVVRVGRGDVDMARVDDGFRQLKCQIRDREAAVNRLLDTTALGEYVSEGLERFRRESIDIDSLADDAIASPS